MDRDLVEKAKDGDTDAFGVIAGAVGDRMFAVAYRILRTRDLAEDAVQQALVQAWKELDQLREPERFEAWLHRVLIRCCYKQIERQQKRVDSVRLLQLGDPPADDGTVLVDARDELERGFRRLSTEQRAVLVLHHYLGLGLAEIGAIVGSPPGTVRSRLHYAHRALRAALEADARIQRDTRTSA
jgi:RNA polymerase sigma-70 factor (ECF subfamily)